VVSGGTIADRGTVRRSTSAAPAAPRVGELDEEMVFESRSGRDLHARRDDLADRGHHPRPRDRVAGARASRARCRSGAAKVRAAADRARPAHRRVRARADTKRPGGGRSRRWLVGDYKLDELAAENLVDYLGKQREASGGAHRSHRSSSSGSRDELGDWRVCILSPFGAPGPRAVGAGARAAARGRPRLSDPSAVHRRRHRAAPSPTATRCRDDDQLFPDPDEIERSWSTELCGQIERCSPARFRENAARALLLPRRRPGQRTPLWHAAQEGAAADGRRAAVPDVPDRARDLPRGAARHLRHAGAARGAGGAVATGDRVERRSTEPSPFASSLVFDYVASFLYEGDAPLAERKAAGADARSRRCCAS
jgi:ATP-dependent Lhr-like helicase